MSMGLKTLLVGGLLLGGVAFAQNPAPIGWVSPGSLLQEPSGLTFDEENLAVGDLTGDGLPDIVHADQRDGSVRVIPNALRGRYFTRTPTDPVFIGNDEGIHAAIGDVSGDGVPDLVVLSEERGGDITFAITQPGRPPLWLGTAFGANTTLESSLGLSLGDVTGDGVLDVAVNDPRNRVAYLDGDRVRLVSVAPRGALDGVLRFADFEGDGDQDAVTWLGNTPLLLRNEGARPWVTQGRANLGLGAGRFAFADVLPGNGGAELIGSDLDHLYIAPNGLPDQLWGDWVQTPHPAMAEPVAVDFDGDGDLDLLGAMRAQPYNLLFLENDGAGGFRAQRRADGAGGGNDYSGRVFPTDLNGDGFEDAVVVYGTGNAVVYALGKGVLGASCEPEWNRTVRGRERRRIGTVTVEPLVPLPEPVAVSELTVLVGGAPAHQVLEAIEVVSSAAGSPVVGRLEGEALQGELRIPLAGDGLLVDDAGSVSLRVILTSRADAHQAAPEIQVVWASVDATFTDGEVAPVVNQILQATTWTLPNDPPVAEPDTFEVAEGAAALLDLVANDSDAQGDPLTVEIVDAPASGAVEVVGGSVRYTHDGREAPRDDRFTYRAVDPRGAASEVVEVTLTITPVNDVPVAAPDAYVTREDVPLVMEADLGLLANDSDGEGDLLVVVLDSPPAQGELQLQPDGGFIYLPAPDANGEVTFTYRVDDGQALSDPVTVTITILPDDDAPRPVEGPLQTTPDTPVVLQLSGGDPEGGDAVLLIERFPDRGYLVALRPDLATVTYVPPPGFVGQARFTYRLTDRAVVSEVFEAVVDVGL